MSAADVISQCVFWVFWPLMLLWLTERPSRFRPAFRVMVQSWVYLPATVLTVLIMWALSPGREPFLLIPWGAFIAWCYFRKGTKYTPLRDPLTRDNHEVIE